MTRPILATFVAAALVAACGKEEPKPVPPPKPAPAPQAAATPSLPPLPPEQIGAAQRRTDLPEPPPPPPVAVDTVMVSPAVGADGKPAADGAPITAKDTLHASVDTQGAGRVTMRAVWKHRATDKFVVVREESQTVVTSGPATHVFKAQKPDGWPAGEYQVEIFVEDRAAATRRFAVQ